MLAHIYNCRPTNIYIGPHIDIMDLIQYWHKWHPIKTRLSLIRPSVEIKVQDKQSSQKKPLDDKSKLRELYVGERVKVRNLRLGPKYVIGVILQNLAPYLCSVDVHHGLVWKRHIDHFLKL